MTTRTRIGVLLATAIAVAACSGPEEPGPAETVEQVAHGLADGDLRVGWDALPASYQSDLNGLAHDFAAAVDPELWNRTFAILGKLTRLLEEKEAFILGHPAVAEHMANNAGEDADWSLVVEMIDLLVTCELASVEQLASLDIGSFLDGTGNRFLELLYEASALSSEEKRAEFEKQRETLLALTATLESTEDGVAQVRIEVPGEAAVTQRFVKVEEKWIPAELAEEWSNSMASARESIQQMSQEKIQSNKQAILMQMAMAESALDSLLAAQTAEEFNAGVGAMIGMAVGAMLNSAMTDTSANAPGGGFGAPVVTMNGPGGASPPAAMAGDSLTAEPQVAAQPIAEAPANPLVREMTRDPQRDAVAAARSQIPIDQAPLYVGQTLKISASDGLTTTAKLRGIQGNVFVFEQTIGGGAMTFKLRSDEIVSLRTR